MSISETLVYLWLLPVALQIVLPLGLFVGFFGKKLVTSIVKGTEVGQKSTVSVKA